MANQRLIDKQRSYIEKVMQQYNLTLTEIAKGISAASTTLTRWYNGKPKNALSAITMNKIEERYPLNKDISKPSNLSDAEIALMDAIKDIFIILLHNKQCDVNYLSATLASQHNDYDVQGLPNAMRIMEELKAFVTGELRQPQREIIGRLLHMTPSGSA